MDNTIKLLRPCGIEFPDGKQFAEWGPLWGYHFDAEGNWVRGQAEHLGEMMGQHGGLDIKCPTGTPLISPSDGKILVAGWQDPTNPKKGYGIHVLIELPDPAGWILTGGHFSTLFMIGGDSVKRGEPVGVSGETGNVDGPHSHWQLEKPGQYPRMPFNFEWVNS